MIAHFYDSAPLIFNDHIICKHGTAVVLLGKSVSTLLWTAISLVVGAIADGSSDCCFLLRSAAASLLSLASFLKTKHKK